MMRKRKSSRINRKNTTTMPRSRRKASRAQKMRRGSSLTKALKTRMDRKLLMIKN